MIYRVTQEALTNAMRHSGGTSVDLALTATDQSVLLRVADDGRGLARALPDDTAGLSGMRERALLVHGSLAVQAAEGKGTEVRLAIPLYEARR